MLLIFCGYCNALVNSFLQIVIADTRLKGVHHVVAAVVVGLPVRANDVGAGGNDGARHIGAQFCSFPVVYAAAETCLGARYAAGKSDDGGLFYAD